LRHSFSALGACLSITEKPNKQAYEKPRRKGVYHLHEISVGKIEAYSVAFWGCDFAKGTRGKIEGLLFHQTSVGKYGSAYALENV
jgi:hypothetical protein